MEERPLLSQADLLIGRSQAIRRIHTLIERVKDTDAPVFIWGESGTGKELIARAIHSSGARSRGRFVAVNCGAIPDALLESELFGHVRGAFTGALRDKPGLIEDAHQGTFFLDEIGDLSPHLQSKLLRLLEEKEIRRVGENRVRKVDVRFISATNKDIDKEIEEERFRKDLYYRLKIIAIEISPLRERREDLILLLSHYAEKFCRQMGRQKVEFSPRALRLLLSYSWPGNVRELQNEILRCLVLSGNERLIQEEHLSPRVSSPADDPPPAPDNFFEARDEFEKRFIRQALLRYDFNRTRTAGELGITRQGLFKLIRKHKIDAPPQGKPLFGNSK
jgi:two-component system NtrC family response regulator